MAPRGDAFAPWIAKGKIIRIARGAHEKSARRFAATFLLSSWSEPRNLTSAGMDLDLNCHPLFDLRVQQISEVGA
jgi:hypothetical protein